MWPALLTIATSQAETLSVHEVILDALTQLFRVRELELPLQIAGEQRVTVERLACQAFELLNRVEALVEGADVREPVGDEQLLPVLLVDLAPGAVGPGLGVDEQPVEVEEQAADLVDEAASLDGWLVKLGVGTLPINHQGLISEAAACTSM